MDQKALPAVFGLAAGVLILAACAPRDLAERSMVDQGTLASPLAPAAAEQRLQTALEAEGFTVERRPDGLGARSSDGRFVDCPTLWVIDRSKDSGQRGHFARADSTSTTLDLRLEGSDSGTAVDWRSDYHGNYLNRFDNLRFDERCRGTSAIATLLQEAL